MTAPLEMPSRYPVPPAAVDGIVLKRVGRVLVRDHAAWETYVGDDGSVWEWDRKSGRLLKMIDGDDAALDEAPKVG